MNELNNPLGIEKTSTLLRKFSIPAIIGMVVSALYNVVDRIFISNAPDIGELGLTGITIGFPIMILQLAVALLFGIGGATLFSIKCGQNKPKEADEILGNTFTMLLLSGLLFAILGISFHAPILRMFGASEQALPYSMAYMGIIFYGSVFQMTSLGLNHLMRANGKPNLAMITMFMGAGTNIVLDYVFIFIFKMGMAGAALATIISQAVSMTWILANFIKKDNPHRIQLRYMMPKWAHVKRIASYGTPSFMLQSVNSLLHLILNTKLAFHGQELSIGMAGIAYNGGDLAVAAMGIVNSVQTILLMPITGLNQGVQPIVSFNFGAKKYQRIKSTEFQAMTAATIIVVVGWLITRLFSSQIVTLFNPDREQGLMNFGTFAVYTWFWGLPLVGMQILGANFFQAIGRPTIAMTLTLTRQVLLLIPAILVFSRIWGLNGILYAAPFADIVSAAITGTSFYFGLRGLLRKGEKERELAGQALGAQAASS